MGRLVKLELKKNPFGKYALVSLLVIPFSIFFVFVSLNDSSAGPRTFDESFKVVVMIFDFVFVVFFSVLNAAVIINEYVHRTILLLFTYPVEKKKLIAAKLLLITSFIGLSILIGYALCGLSIVGLDRRFGLVDDKFSVSTLRSWIFQAVSTAVVFCGIGLWTFAVGMRKKSVTATIVSSLVFIFLRQVVVASGESGKDPLWFVLAVVCIAGAALWYTFREKITRLD